MSGVLSTYKVPPPHSYVHMYHSILVSQIIMESFFFNQGTKGPMPNNYLNHRADRLSYVRYIHIICTYLGRCALLSLFKGSLTRALKG